MGFDDVADALEAAKPEDASPQTLDLLSDHWSPVVREIVAAHFLVPPFALRRLATDPSQYVRWRAAQHVNVPLDALAVLVFDRVNMVRRAARRNPKFADLPVEVHVEAALLPV